MHKLNPSSWSPPPRRSAKLRRNVIGLTAAFAMVVPLAIVSAPAPALAVTDETPSFVLNQNDLEFILRQVQISEAHAADEADPSNYTYVCADPSDLSGTCVTNVAQPGGVRTVDGSYNNLIAGQSEFGSGGLPFPRLLDPEWLQGEAPPPFAPPNAPGVTASCEAGLTCYTQTEGFVYDSDPRIISNLIVDQTTGNPAIVNQLDAGTATLLPQDPNVPDLDPDTEMVSTPNTAPDEALSAPFNTFLGFFGQFFDHGLDLVKKGGNGTLVVPLEPDDPLYEAGSPTNFLVLTRATRADDAAGNPTTEHTNLTTPFVDQNQTYASHPAHQVFLREYAPGGGATGKLIEGAAGGMATWTEVKDQARTILGIDLTDADVLAVPQLVVDPYGNFVPGPLRGMPQLIVSTGPGVDDIAFREGDPGAPVSTAGALTTGTAFLDDIAHGATPVFDANGNLVPQYDENGQPTTDILSGYNNVALGEHFIAGDGRVNENIGLTAVHAVFHAEHNRMVEQIEALLNGDPSTALLRNDQTMADPALLAEFAKAFRGEAHAYPSAVPELALPQPQADDWTYEQRLFQAAKFATEMQYQHIVFEEFGRTISPSIDPVVFNENSYNPAIDPAIMAEFADVVYRFGHSMMTEEIGREDVPGTAAVESDVSLLDGFLNPDAFDDGGALTPDQAVGSLIDGMTSRVGSQIDEYVTDTLRNNLLGLPLDLATINMARARDVGIPPLQTAREEFFRLTGDSSLEPYSDWVDFGLGLRNGNNFGRGGNNASLVNFVAAYGTHPTVEAATTVVGRRAAASLLVNGAPVGSEFISRFPGASRFHTAALFSQRHYEPGIDTVYVTNGLNFPDALSAGALGKPILLVPPGSAGTIPAETHEELLRLAPGRIVVLGDTASVGANTVLALNAISATDAPVTRIAGPNRYATSAAISATFTGPVERVFIANGENFPDALAGAAVAAQGNSPVLLVTPNGIPAVIAAELQRLNPPEIVVLGGTPSVSAAVATQLDAFTTGPVIRLAGASRYDTAVEISKQFFPTGADRVYVTTGTNFPDAVTAAPGAGLNGSPILLLPPTGMTPAIRAEIERLAPTEIFILGDTNSVSAATELNLASLAPTPLTAPADRLEFMNSTGAWADANGGTTTGLESVDLWVGGLAEKIDAFGGMLGSTFNYVFETQLEKLQFGDRFYYLFRNPGVQLFAALEGNSLSDLIQRNSDASNLPANIFSLNEQILDLDALPNPLPAGLLQGADGSWRWSGVEHLELHGTAGPDNMSGDEGDDSLWGYEGNDRIEGGGGNDSLVGGPGDDIITDSFGDDVIHGDQGNDAIHVGAGIDLAIAGLGDDFAVNGGGGAGSSFFMGMGDDVVTGTSGRATVFGGEQHDWVEGGSHADLLQGDNADQQQDDTLGGSDVVLGRLGNDDIEGEGGDDILVGAAVGTDRHLGNLGFDWLTYYGQTANVTADFAFTSLVDPNNPLRSRFDQLESLSGGAGNDTLRGPLIAPTEIPAHLLPLERATEASIDLVDGLEGLLRPTPETDYAARLIGPPDPAATGMNMVILGGPGDDTVEGRAGDDFLDGDAMLRVQLLDSATGQRYDSANDVEARVFAGTVNPGNLDIVREIVSVDGGSDTSVYSDVMAAYTITQGAPGYWQVEHATQGSDVIRGFERLQFSDGCATLNEAGDAWEACDTTFAVSLSTDTPLEGVPVVATVVAPDGTSPLDASAFTGAEFVWLGGKADFPENVTEWVELARQTPGTSNGATLASSFTPGVEENGMFLRVSVTYRDGSGVLHTASSPVTGSFVTVPNELPVGPTLVWDEAPAAPTVGSLLIATEVLDANGLEEGTEFVYEWTSSTDPTVPPGSTVLGSEVESYQVVAADVGSFIRVTVTYTDAAGYAETATAVLDVAVVAATP
ncbi:peroxidase family protein [Agrococcus beijingensis]|uniref:peroxidase family protein n=1 Tax=Agrococcus beijingensis TaxID=3068634 RepID=UPI00274217EA|nr:peroxidase family protein [Agrococcus sp. REN33]